MVRQAAIKQAMIDYDIQQDINAQAILRNF
jgi:hypothetical protein